MSKCQSFVKVFVKVKMHQKALIYTVCQSVRVKMLTSYRIGKMFLMKKIKKKNI